MLKLYKSLPANMAPHGFQYALNTWHKYAGKISICNSGFHCSKNLIDAMGFVDAEIIAQVEVRGKSEQQDDKQCWSELKIVKAWKWEKPDSVSLAIYAAELVIDIYEKQYPNDKRPRKAIEAAKKVLEHDTEEHRSAARSAAESAESAESAAWSDESARSAAESARSAARSAAESAAWSAESAWFAAWSAAESARSAIKEKCHKFVLDRLKHKKPLTT